MQISSAGVVGLGTMGAGIVEVFARAGLSVVAVEVNDTLVAAGRERLAASLHRAVDRGRLEPAARDEIVDRVRFSADRAELAAVDLVTEAIPERMELKAALFAELDEICQPEAVLATNTSSLPVTQIATTTRRPEQVVGMHFFNPAPVMRLVEVVHTVTTRPDVVAGVRELATRCGKTPVVVGDRAGFVANGLLFGYLNAAAKAAECGYAATADIDRAMQAATGFPMGPLTLLDLIGLDVSLDVLETMFAETRDQRYAAAPLLRRLVMAGQLGRKTGRGYYRYEGKSTAPAVGVREPAPAVAAHPVVTVLAGFAHRLRDVVPGADRLGPEECGSAALVLIDGGSTAATAELASRVSRVAPAEAVLAVATSDEAPTATVAAATERPSQVVGLHVPRTLNGGVIEVVVPHAASREAAATVTATMREAGLITVECTDRPGHVVDGLLLPHLGDAVRMVDDGYATTDDVDAAMTLGCGYPTGPFGMLAALGADDVRSGLLHLAAASHLPALAPAPLLDELAAAGG